MLDRVVIVVFDALGIGAMEDVPEIRPRDEEANTLLHVLKWRDENLQEPSSLGALAALGLGRLVPHPSLPSEAVHSCAVYGEANLGYPGADSYIAHQTIMGTDMNDIRLEPFSTQESKIAEVLQESGHTVRRAIANLPVLMVDECMVIGDNLEADPGLNYNVTGSLDLTSFDHISEVAHLVRAHVPISRVIAVGGLGLEADGLVAKLRKGEGVYGIDTPATGFYDRDGLMVQHIGVDFDRSKQLPSAVFRANLPVALVGKMADVLDCPEATLLPAVPTGEVLDSTCRVLDDQQEGLIAVNIQEMDLAGHRQNPARWAEVLECADRGLARILGKLSQNDLLIVLGDHGNDPTIGHEFHTRERVPLLSFSPGLRGSCNLFCNYITRRTTLADVGATAAKALGLNESLELGSSFLSAAREK